MKEREIPKSKQNRFYVLYKGDDIACTGTIAEIHAKTGIPIDHIIWLTYPIALKREQESKGNRMVMVDGGLL